MDWSFLSFAGFNKVYLDQYVRASNKERSAAAIHAAGSAVLPQLNTLDQHLTQYEYPGGSQLTIADLPAGSLLHRWLHWAPNCPPHPHVEACSQRLAAHPGYRKHVIEANKPRTSRVKSELLPIL